MSNDMVSRVVYIVGTGRCGTKWVAGWLSENKDIFTGTETHIMPRMAEIYTWWGPLAWLDKRKDILDNIVRKFLIEFYDQRSSNGRTICLDHTPLNVMFIDLITRLFPDSKFIMLYRDGKQVVHSTKERNWGKDFSIETICNKWIKNAEYIMRGTPDNVLPVRYEDLLNSPEVSRQITSFFGLEHHGDIQPWDSPTNTDNHKYEPRQWTKRSVEDLRVMKMMNPYLVKMGYDPI